MLSQITGLFLYVFIALVALGCSKTNNSVSANGVSSVDTYSRSTDSLLDEFKLVVPVGNPLLEKAPAVGALVYVPPHGAWVVCSVGRVGEFAITNVHCLNDAQRLDPSASIDDFVFFYIDKDDYQQRRGYLTEVVYRGDEGQDDILVLKMDEEAVAHWNTFPIERKNLLGVLLHPIQGGWLHAVDPVPSPTREIGKPEAHGISVVGAVYSPKKLTWSPFQPAFAEKEDEDLIEKPLFGPSKRLDFRKHIFLENLNPSTVVGNSGGMVVDEKGFAVATFHWHKLKQSIPEGIWFRGADQKWQDVWSRESPLKKADSLFGVATKIEAYIY